MKLNIFNLKINITKQCLPRLVHIEKIENGFLIDNTFLKTKNDCISYITKLLKKSIK